MFLFFDDRLAFNADYYIKNTYGMLQQQQVAGFIGLPYDKPYVNIGEMKNTGFELSLSGTVLDNKIREKTFKWVAAFNISFNQNTVVKLYQSTPRYTNIGLNSQPAITQEGDPYGTFYGWVTDGVFQNQNDIDKHAKQTGAAPGDIRFKDLNGDGVIDDKDRTTLGSPFPKFNYGFTNTFSFYNFDLTVFIQGVSGNKIYNFNRQVNEAMSSVANQYATVLDRWTGEGTSNSMPRAVYADPNGNSRVSDRFIEDGSYIRLQNLQITYNLPEGMLSKIHMRLLSVYLSSQNLVTLTKYSGFSPDIGNYTGSGVNFYSPGIDFGLYPNPRTITIGAKLGF
jgi:hypothetical protein